MHPPSPGFRSDDLFRLSAYFPDVNDGYSRLYPRLYTPGQRDLFFNKKVFGMSVAEGTVTSVVLFFVPYLTFKESTNPHGVDISGHRALGFVVASILIVVVTLRCALETAHWTGFNHFVSWGSLVFYFVFILIFYSEPFGYSYEGVATTMMATAAFWFSLLLCTVLLLVPVVFVILYRRTTRPTLTDKVRLLQQGSKTKVASQDRVIRRASTSVRSQRSLRRSGYAFAHQGGYGDLITSGSMLHLRPKTGGAGSVSRAVTSAAVLTAAAAATFPQRLDDDQRATSTVCYNMAYEDGEEEMGNAHAQNGMFITDLESRPRTATDMLLNDVTELTRTDQSVVDTSGYSSVRL